MKENFKEYLETEIVQEEDAHYKNYVNKTSDALEEILKGVRFKDDSRAEMFLSSLFGTVSRQLKNFIVEHN